VVVTIRWLLSQCRHVRVSSTANHGSGQKSPAVSSGAGQVARPMGTKARQVRDVALNRYIDRAAQHVSPARAEGVEKKLSGPEVASCEFVPQLVP
jgi:hypothetical protein